MGNSLVVQQAGLHAPTAKSSNMDWTQALKSHKLCSGTAQNEKTSEKTILPRQSDLQIGSVIFMAVNTFFFFAFDSVVTEQENLASNPALKPTPPRGVRMLVRMEMLPLAHPVLHW